MAKELTLEEGFERLDEILEQMDEADIPLEEAFGLYREGMKTLQVCNEKLVKVEQQVLALSKDGEVTDFTGE